MSSNQGGHDRGWAYNGSHPDSVRPGQSGEPHTRRMEPLRTMEPAATASRLPPLPHISHNYYESHEDQRRRLPQQQQHQQQQLPGLHELLSPVNRLEPSSSNPAVRYAAGPMPTQGMPPATELPSPFARPPASWQQRTPSDASSTSTYGSRGSLLSGPTPFSAPTRPMQPPSLPASANMQYQQQAPRLSGISGLEMRPPFPRPPSVSENMRVDQRRDSVRPNTPSTLGASDCVGQRQIPGKGLCYVYQDGNTCPTVIDGEVVNPMWGTTKAGKARKRLAQACLNCREKKIRCEPRHPRCLQCEKSKRDCIMPPASQSQTDTMTPCSTISATSTFSSTTSTPQGSSEEHAANDVLRMPAPKRRRSADVSSAAHSPELRDLPYLAAIESGMSRSDFRSESSATPRNESDNPTYYPEKAGKSATYSSDAIDWDTDPYEVNSDETLRLLDSFFTQQTSMNHNVFPRAAFTRWVEECRTKCQNECMVLYSLLALGTVFSRDNSQFAKLCLDRASRAVTSKFGKFSLPLVQSRLFLAMYHHAKGRDQVAYDYSGTANRAMVAERLFLEEGCAVNIEPLSRNLFGFSREQLIECKRRTFWTAFLLDACLQRISSFCAGTMCAVQTRGIQIRLPCPEMDYEDGTPSEAPLFGSSVNELKRTISFRAYTLLLAQLWAEALDFTQLGVHEAAATYAQNYEAFLNEMQAKLSRWRDSLPPEMQISPSNLQRSLDTERASVLWTSFAMYHVLQLQLVRFARHSLLRQDSIYRNIDWAHRHSKQILQLSSMLCNFAQTLPENQGLHTMLSPFLGFAVFLAIDTITAAGLRSDLEEVLDHSMDGSKILRVIGYSWASGRAQSNQTERRIADLQMYTRDAKDRSTGPTTQESKRWRMERPMERVFGTDCDVLYGIDDATLYQGLQDTS